MLPTELMDKICSMVSPRKGLAAMSLVTRVMNNLANAYIWQTIYDLYPLLHCLPADLWDEENARKFKRKVRESDLDSFRRHASLIRHYGPPLQELQWLVNNVDNRGTSSILEQLSVASPGSPLLPNVREMVLFYQHELLEVAHLHTMFGNHVTHFDLSLPDMDPNIIPSIAKLCTLLLHRLLKTNPAVEWLRIAGCGIILPIDLSPEPLTRLTLLDITLRNPTQRDIAFISRLLSLQRLHISFEFDKAPVLGVSAANSSAGPFPALKHFKVHSEWLSACLGITSLMRNTPLETAEFRVSELIPDDAGTMFEQLRTGCNHESVMRVDVIEQQIANEDDLPRIGPKQLRPLLSFRNMSDLSFLVGRGYDFDDQFLEELAVSWPTISSIRLRTEVYGNEHVSLKGLQSLATHCPRLKHLTLNFNAYLPPEGILPLKKPSLSNLEKLDIIQISPIPDGKAVALLLNNMFPRLRRFAHSNYMKWTVENYELGNAIRTHSP